MPKTSRAPRPFDLDNEPVDGQMGFLEHLDELRRRIIRCCVALVAGMLVAAAFYERLADFILQPTLRVLPPGAAFVYLKPGEGFSFYFDVALIGGAILAMPFVTYQVWRFVAPALYPREKRLVVPFLMLSSIGSVGGAAFSHYVLFPGMIKFFGTFNSPTIRFTPRLEDTFELYKNLLLGMVLVFQLPAVVLLLARVKLLTARFLWHHFGYAVLAIFTIAALLTPSTDPWNQTAFAVPMVVLYLISIVIAWFVGPKREKGTSGRDESVKLRLVFAAAVIDRAWHQRQHSRGEFPRAM